MKFLLHSAYVLVQFALLLAGLWALIEAALLMRNQRK